ncbi:putative Ulp1 protease family catalytic domain, papain-like cysteine peptidase superfamily [Helianthus anomalus]
MREVRLTFRKWISHNVIDCLAARLNYIEKKNNPGGKRQLWCYTTTMVIRKKAFATLTTHLKEVVESDNKFLELKEFNIIIIPMIENKHFYLICLDLENKRVKVIDNMVNNNGFYKMMTGTKFKEIGSPCKVKHYMVGYLKAVKHPMAACMAGTMLTKKRVEWATNDNFNDCGVFAMRHMEMYRGSDVKFECGFSTRKDIQDMQLKNMRIKIATKLLFSEANVYKGTVMDLAKETTHGLKDKRVQKMLDKEALKQEECWNMLNR